MRRSVLLSLIRVGIIEVARRAVILAVVRVSVHVARIHRPFGMDVEFTAAEIKRLGVIVVVIARIGERREARRGDVRILRSLVRDAVNDGFPAVGGGGSFHRDVFPVEAHHAVKRAARFYTADEFAGGNAVDRRIVAVAGESRVRDVSRIHRHEFAVEDAYRAGQRGRAYRNPRRGSLVGVDAPVAVHVHHADEAGAAGNAYGKIAADSLDRPHADRGRNEEILFRHGLVVALRHSDHRKIPRRIDDDESVERGDVAYVGVGVRAARRGKHAPSVGEHEGKFRRVDLALRGVVIYVDVRKVGHRGVEFVTAEHCERGKRGNRCDDDHECSLLFHSCSLK